MQVSDNANFNIQHENKMKFSIEKNWGFHVRFIIGMQF